MNELTTTLLEAMQEVSGTVLVIAGIGLWGWMWERRDRKRNNR